MIEVIRAMQPELPLSQLVDWFGRGVAVILAIRRVASCNNRTRRPIPGED